VAQPRQVNPHLAQLLGELARGPEQAGIFKIPEYPPPVL
jgi:hypothetical protein